MDYYAESLKIHEQNHGKLEIASKVPVTNRDELSCAYTPGVAQPCLEIKNDPSTVYTYTCKQNTVAVVSDGSAVLGLGNIGPSAAIPVMEGKSILFKQFGNVDAFPICLDTQDTEEIIAAVKNIAPVFGGINLEDIAAPRCFEIERRLEEALEIPVFHDDQHGTAIVVTAALINAAKVVGKTFEDLRVVVNGAGSAGTAIIKMLQAAGIKDITACDLCGVLHPSLEGLDSAKTELCHTTNPRGITGTLADAMRGADVFIGVSAPDIVTPDMVASMAQDAIVFPMANPKPEIMPDLAKQAGAAVVGCGRSDYPNQINNVLAFPGIFRGALDAHARNITPAMKVAAANAIASLVGDGDDRALSAEYIIPSVFDKRVAPAVAKAVKEAWE